MLNEELKIVKPKDDSQWYQVLTPAKQGYIPKSSLIEESFLDLFSDSSTALWDIVKDKNSNKKTSNSFPLNLSNSWIVEGNSYEKSNILIILHLLIILN